MMSSGHAHLDRYRYAARREVPSDVGKNLASRERTNAFSN